jgi:hypothetical protein
MPAGVQNPDSYPGTFRRQRTRSALVNPDALRPAIDAEVAEREGIKRAEVQVLDAVP